MGDYIKREDAIRAVRAFIGLNEDERQWAIEDIPSADVVKVVRCKDCKHLYKDGECPLRTWFTHDEDDFCSYGEEQENERLCRQDT